ncbi:putative thioesterase involved in non-ribosomal peptide biosynthesis [Mycobacterium sp. JS623]|uniref:thioesterase II family protein n=1 Tax=Mycobacterium sp. JS623 TaxID=212767 RepID=UPI0002A57D38|nr:alpha/beta fold hydrolase [Mycobacterium sp. JS623]AGB24507.1 putative thioesterase involved in non-ribosomal peptide biosynthesis [Mycobacterium sp. JS623]
MTRVKLFCFPHAGGSAVLFNGWRRALGPRVEIVAVDVSHRERFATLRALVDEIHSRRSGQMDSPHAFFGHSFGALVAYRLACLRVAAGVPQPTALILSSYPAPHLAPPIPAAGTLDDDRLATLLTDLGGIPPELAEWPALRDVATAAARNDLRLCETDEDDPTTVLPCPIHVLGGIDDPLVAEPDLDQWRTRTCGRFSSQMLPGGHFYLTDEPQLFPVLRRLLSASEVGSVKC